MKGVTYRFALAVQIVLAATALAGEVELRVRTDAKEVYVALVREDAPWREPLRESVLQDGARVVRWSVPPGRYRAVGGAAGWTTAYADGFIVAERGVASVPLELTALTPLTGHVRDGEGKPIAGARVGLVRAFVHDASQKLSELAEEHLRANHLAESDAEGRFRILAHPTAAHLLYVEADGFAPSFLRGVTATNAAALQPLTLTRGASIRASVPEPSAADRVVLIPERAPLPDGLGRDLALAIWTRPIASPASWTSLPPGRYQIAYDTMSGVPQVVATIDLAAGQTTNVTLPPARVTTVPRSAPDRVRIFLHNATRATVEGAKVTRWSASSAVNIPYKIEEVSGGLRLVVVDGCRADSRYLVRTTRHIAAAFAGSDAACRDPLTAELRPAATAAVQLRAAPGSSLPQRAMVRLQSCDRRSQLLGEYPVVIDAEGLAEFSLPAGCHLATLFAGRFAPLSLGRSTPGTTARHVYAPARLEAGGVLLVRVVDRAARPLDGITVTAVPREDLEQPLAMPIAELPPLARAVTSEGGWARLSGIPASDVVLVVSDGQRRHPMVSEPYRADTGQQLLVDPLELLPPAELAVTIASPDDFELLEVTLVSGSGNAWPKRAAIRGPIENGAATFADVPPGRWLLAVYGRIPGQLATVVGSGSVTTVAGERAETTVKVASARRSGVVRLRGEPVRGSITFRPAGGGPTTVPVDARGTFAALLRPGTYTIEFVQNAQEGPLGYVKLTDFAIADDASEIRVDLPASRLSGRVVTVDGNAVPGATVRAIRSGSEAELEVRSDRDGAFSFAAVPAGTWTLEASGSKLESERPTLSVAERQELAGIVLRVSPVEEVTIQVIDSRGQPLSGAEVVVTALSSDGVPPRVHWGRSGARGELTLAVHKSVYGATADVKVLRAGGMAASQRRVITDPLLVQLRAPGDVELVWEEPPATTPLLEALVAADGSALPLSFLRATRQVRDGRPTILIPQIESGAWSYVGAQTPQQVELIANGRAASLPPLARFQVQPAVTTTVVIAKREGGT